MDTMIPVKSANQDLDVIVFGRAGMDLYPHPPGTKTEQAKTFRSDLGGSAGNIAVALSRHGKKVGLIAPVSDDPIGRFVSHQLEAYGIRHLTPQPVALASRTSLAIAESRATDCEVVIYRNNAADFHITPDNFNLLDVDRGPLLIVTGTALAHSPSREACLQAMARAEYSIIDLDYRAYSWRDNADTEETYRQACEAADMIVGNDEEFDIIAPGQALEWAEAAAKSGKCVIVKSGERGSITMYKDQKFRQGIFPVKALKPFGAGDAFMGGLVATLLNGKTLEQAVRFGSASAAMVVSRLGCARAMPTADQVNSFVASATSRQER